MERSAASAFRLSVLVLAASAAALPQQTPGAAVVKNTPGKPQVASVPAGRGFVPQGAAESVRNRVIAANELAVVDMCRVYVEAQLSYLGSVHDADGFPAFAQKIRSTPGRRDGLYWPLDSEDDESPIGPNFAAAAITEEQPAGNPRPYFGYYFKILLAQGPEAAGGARDYRVNGRLIGGFALVAWPAEYGVTGVHSFLVNHLGDIYAKDLGSDTSLVAAGMSAFAPNRTWSRVASAAHLK